MHSSTHSSNLACLLHPHFLPAHRHQRIPFCVPSPPPHIHIPAQRLLRQNIHARCACQHICTQAALNCTQGTQCPPTQPIQASSQCMCSGQQQAVTFSGSGCMPGTIPPCCPPYTPAQSHPCLCPAAQTCRGSVPCQQGRQVSTRKLRGHLKLRDTQEKLGDGGGSEDRQAGRQVDRQIDIQGQWRDLRAPPYSSADMRLINISDPAHQPD